MGPDARKARAQELLLPAPALAPFCPALREVRVELGRSWEVGGIQAATWLRPGP